MTAFRILFAAAFVFTLCLASGQLLFRAIGLTLRRYETTFLGFIAGAVLVSNAVFALALFRAVYTSLLVGGGVAIIGAWLYVCRPYARPARPEPPVLPLAWRALFGVPWAIFGALYLLAAMAPEISPDAPAYHLGLISRYYDHRGFVAIPSNMYSGLSEGVEMLFWIAFAIGRHSAAAVLHLTFLLTLPFGMLAYARRIAIPEAGVVAALLFYLAPVVGRDGTVAYIDVATAAVVFGAFCFLQIWRTENQTAALIPAGLLAGFAYACKFTAGTAAVYALVFVVAVSYARRTPARAAWRAAATIAVLALAVAAPWLVKNIVQFQNPFYPLFNHWFPNRWQYPMVEDEWRHFMEHVSDVTLARIPWQATVGGKLAGIVGPVFLLSPLALLSLRRSPGRQLLAAFVALFLPYFGNIGARFLIPSLPFLALALALGVLSIPKLGKGLAIALAIAHSFLSWPSWIERWAPAGFQWHIDTLDLSAALRIKPEAQFFDEHWPFYRAGLMLDRFVPPADLVFSITMDQLAYQHRNLLGGYQSAVAQRALRTFNIPLDPALAASWRREFTFPALSAKAIRVVADGASSNDFQIAELRLFNRGGELTRAPEWRLTAQTNPWEVQLAFDNSAISWWTSGERTKPGAWIGVQDFGRALSVSRVEVLQPVDQRWVELHVEAWEEGRWENIPAVLSAAEVAPPPDLRMKVRDELKSMGIRWILMADEARGADDLLNKSPWWGITQIARSPGFRLWRLD